MFKKILSSLVYVNVLYMYYMYFIMYICLIKYIIIKYNNIIKSVKDI